MKLYDAGRAPNPRRVRIFIAEKGLPMPELEAIDLGKLEHKSPAFTALYPAQRTPVLVLDDGTVIGESVAICRYFEELHPLPALFGTGAKEKALVEMANRHVELGLFTAVQQVFRHLHPSMAAMEVPQVPEWGEANKPKVLNALLALDAQLEGRSFVCGESFTIADITAGIACDFLRVAKMSVPDEFANVKRWHEVLKARPSWNV